MHVLQRHGWEHVCTGHPLCCCALQDRGVRRTWSHIAVAPELQPEGADSLAHLLRAGAGPPGLPGEGKAGQAGHHHMEGLLLAAPLRCKPWKTVPSSQALT